MIEKKPVIILLLFSVWSSIIPVVVFQSFYTMPSTSIEIKNILLPWQLFHKPILEQCPIKLNIHLRHLHHLLAAENMCDHSHHSRKTLAVCVAWLSKNHYKLFSRKEKTSKH